MIQNGTVLDRRRLGARRTPVRPERGSILIEAALTLPLVLMLVFGMITGGLALGQKNSIENSAREASRFGATLEVTTSTDDWLDDVSEVAIDAATGELDAGTPDRYVCVALVGTSNGDDGRKIIDGDTVTYDTGACPDMICPQGRPCVHVKLRRGAVLDLVATSHSLTLDASGMTIFERH